MKKYKVVYADPPWLYRNKGIGRLMKSGSADKYPCMDLEEIENLPIQNLADKNSVLFLWATVPLLPEALEVMSAWGYKYKTLLVWRKIMSLGLGYWFRGQIEILLLGVRGKIKAFRIQKPNFIQTKVGKHSEKPDEFRKLIEETGLSPCIELFARGKRKRNTLFGDVDGFEGWDIWGNECESDIDMRDYE